MGRKYFGTDGVRGRVGAYPITPEFVMKLGNLGEFYYLGKFRNLGKFGN